MEDPLNLHYSTVIKAIVDGRVVPLLGAGVNLCDRPVGASYERGRFLPSGGELAEALAQEAGYPREGRAVECPHCHEMHQVQYPLDLLKVSQHMAAMEGLGPLYEELRGVFDANYQPSSLHSLLADLPSAMKAAGLKPRYQLIVTTNYDDVLETAFDNAREPYDVVSYVADGEHRGKFWHWSPDAGNRLVQTANDYAEVTTDNEPIRRRAGDGASWLGYRSEPPHGCRGTGEIAIDNRQAAESTEGDQSGREWRQFQGAAVQLRRAEARNRIGLEPDPAGCRSHHVGASGIDPSRVR